jgi:uncharacterized paraquat-inducible protein A
MTYGPPIGLPGERGDSPLILIRCPKCGMRIRLGRLEVDKGDAECPRCGALLRVEDHTIDLGFALPVCDDL